MEVYSIGFTKKTAEHFFTTLRDAGIRRLVDVRLNNTSNLAGWAKKDNLRYLLREIGSIEYLHEVRLAPTQELLDAYRKRKGGWDAYQEGFLQLVRDRDISNVFPQSLLCDEPTVLLCSEPAADQCHRRLVLEYLSDKWGGLQVTHL